MHQQIDNESDIYIYGKNSIVEALSQNKVSKVLTTSKRRLEKDLVEMLNKFNVPYHVVEKQELDKLVPRGTNHQNLVALVVPYQYVELEEMITKGESKSAPLFFLLDEVQNPMNLGAILRGVDCFGIDGVVFKKRRNVQLNATVAKTSAGAIEHVDIGRVTNIKHAIERLKKAGYWIAFLDMNGETKLQDVDFSMKLAIVVGGEDKGVTSSVKKYCDFGIKIPMTGQINSLNVATATSIVAYSKSLWEYGTTGKDFTKQ